MGAPITIKKRTVSPKKPASNEQAAGPSEGTVSGRTMNVSIPAGDADKKPIEKPKLSRKEQKVEEKEPESNVLLSQPKPTGNTKGSVSSKATNIAAVFALVTLLLFLFVLLLQVTEFIDISPLFPVDAVGTILAVIPL